MRKPKIQQKPLSKPKKPQRPPCAGTKAPAPPLAAWKSDCPVCGKRLKLRGSTTGDGLCFPRHCPPAPKPEKVIPDVSNTLRRKRLKGNAPGDCNGLIEAVVTAAGLCIGYRCTRCGKRFTVRKPKIQQKPRSKPKKPQRPPCAGTKAPAPPLAAWKSDCPVCGKRLKLRGSTTGDGLCFPRHCPPAPKPEKVIPDVSNTLCRKRLKGNAPGDCNGLIEAVVTAAGLCIGYRCTRCGKHYPKATTTDVGGNERNKR